MAKVITSATNCKCCGANIQYDGSDLCKGFDGYMYIICPVCHAKVYPGIKKL